MKTADRYDIAFLAEGQFETGSRVAQAGASAASIAKGK